MHGCLFDRRSSLVKDDEVEGERVGAEWCFADLLPVSTRRSQRFREKLESRNMLVRRSVCCSVT